MADVRSRTSCDPCRKRKIKCDANSPCSSCVLRKVESSCIFHSDRNDPQASLASHAPPSTSIPAHPPKRRRHSTVLSHSPPFTPTADDVQSMKASVRQLQMHIEQLEAKLAGSIPESNDPVERDNWRRLLEVIPDKVVVEVLLEYLVLECDWLWPCRDVVKLWKRSIDRKGVASALAGVLCMTLAMSCLFLGPYQTPLYRVPIDAAELHPKLFATAQTFLSGGQDLEELELLQALSTYSVFAGRIEMVPSIMESAMMIAISGGWLDENSEAWRDLTGEDRNRARLVLTDIEASHKWNVLTTPLNLPHTRINLCRPDKPSLTLSAPVQLSLPGATDLPLRVFRVRSEEELRMGGVFRDLMLDFSHVLPRVRQLLDVIETGQADDALPLAGRLQQEMQEWRLTKIPNAQLQLPLVHDIDPNSPLSCQSAARAFLLHSAISCIESIITRHWLTLGRVGPPLQQYLHDESLLNAQRNCDSIPIVRAVLNSRHAPFASTFIIIGLFNAATCFAIPLLRAVHVMTGKAEEQIRNLPVWPEHDTRNVPNPQMRPSISPRMLDPSLKRYANNILVVLDMLNVLNALPVGKQAQQRMEELLEHFDIRNTSCTAPPTHQVPPMEWPMPVDRTGAGAAGPSGDMGRAAAGVAPVPEAIDPFPGMWDELLQLDPSIWEDLLRSGNGA